MKLWIAGTVPQVIEAAQTGIPSAIVTNPTVVAQWTTAENEPIEAIAERILEATELPLYIQLRGPDKAAFLKEANYFRTISPRILSKLPSTTDGIAAAAELERRGLSTLVTTVCSLSQAYLCAAAGVDAICPYFARLGESGTDPAGFIARTSAPSGQHPHGRASGGRSRSRGVRSYRLRRRFPATLRSPRDGFVA